MARSNVSKGSEKPAKPRPDFPLFAHATGRWAKKIKGKLHYFGPWADPDAALARYVEERDDLYAGRKPRRKGEGLTVKDLINKFPDSNVFYVDCRYPAIEAESCRL